MTAEALAFWRRMAPILHAAGLLTDADIPAFQMLAEDWAVWKRTAKGLESPVTKAPKTKVPMLSLEWVANRQVGKDITRRLAEFGMTPASRTGIHAEVPTPKDQADEEAKFFAARDRGRGRA